MVSWGRLHEVARDCRHVIEVRRSGRATHELDQGQIVSQDRPALAIKRSVSLASGATGATSLIRPSSRTALVQVASTTAVTESGAADKDF